MKYIVLLIAAICFTLVTSQTVKPKVDPEPINLQYKAVLYRLDYQTVPLISPAMRAVLLLTTLYYIIVFAKALVEIQIYRTEGKKGKSQSINTSEDADEENSLLNSVEMSNRLEDYEQNLRGVMEGIPMLAILITFARLRARVDLEGTTPQEWVQIVFLVAVAILYMQAIVAVCCSPGKDQKKSVGLQKCIKLIKIILTGCLMACVVAIFVSIYTLTKKPVYAEKH